MLRNAASRVVALSALAGVAYLAVALYRVRKFSERLAPPSAPDASMPERNGSTVVTEAPAMTILKPLRGLEPGLEENLASFCDQDYDDFQIVFSATEADDPAISIARRVVERFPSVDAEIVVAPADSEIANPKIANAINAAARAKHPIVVMSDADMRVDRRYLRAIAAEFTDAEVGAVTCLYGGVPEGGLASTVAAMFINDHFAPSVLVAGALEPPRYTFGSTMAVRREVLEAIGGMPALGASIADDARLGELVSAAGRRVAIASYVVANIQETGSLADVWEREVRWARTIRSVRPAGSTMAVVTYAFPLALIAWLLRPRSVRRAAILAAAVVLRLALHDTARKVLAPTAPASPHLIPLRDLMAFAAWGVSRRGRNARWKGEHVVV